MENVAYGGAATLSKIMHGGEASRIIDQNPNGDWNVGKIAFAVKDKSNVVWINVDFKYLAQVSYVALFDRVINSYTERRKDVEVGCLGLR